MNTAFEVQLTALTKLFRAEKIKYAILGGVAVSLYGEPRLTLDIDVNVSISKNSIGGFLRSARKVGFYPIPKNIKSFVRKTGVIPMKFVKGKIVGRCDIIIAQNAIEYLALERTKIKKINSTKVRVVSPEDLIIHKITSSRPRDIEDLRGIIARQKGKIDLRYIKSWLRKLDNVGGKPRLLKLFEKVS